MKMVIKKQQRLQHQIKIILILTIFVLIKTANAQHYGLFINDNTAYLYDSIKSKVVDSIRKETINTKYALDSLTLLSFTQIGSISDPPSPNIVMIFYDISSGKLKKNHILKISMKDYPQLFNFDFDVNNGQIVIYKKKGVIGGIYIRVRRRINLETLLSILKTILLF